MSRWTGRSDRLIGTRVLAVLIAAAVFGWLGMFPLVARLTGSRITPAGRTRVQLIRWVAELSRYYEDCGEFPSSQQGLRALAEDPDLPGWRGPYFGRGNLWDSWDMPFLYEIVNETPRVVSAGADRRFGTADDLVDTVETVPASHRGRTRSSQSWSTFTTNKPSYNSYD